MSTTILLIRHGETAWNAARRLQGHTDIDLNDEGMRQAEALGEALAGAPLAAVVSSDLRRARQTAAAVAGQHGLALQADCLLRERCYGAFEGMLYADIAERYPLEYAEWQARHIDAVMPAGERVAESFRQFYRRAVDGVERWAARYPGQTIAVVAHGGVLECAYRAAVGMSLDSPRDFQVKNASVNRFAFAAGKLTLTQWGDVEHLSAGAIDELG
ncbi:2,3-bisphosphoglycerate-dependent phosphoglycerate mutase [Janthinobacterium sp. CG_23.3]|uniref:histidine phosphatase family protein n=1 Tax=unclassified Janthinobacterium TaxID=2610881 RepID=UPI00034BD499|nr:MULTISPECIES: histidine phosphatase family protein [unclassified Janthinobacterium]MEC5163849.1 putative phosphoglycerate mutase [Janthinobacterium sp. CG_S6]